MQPLFYAAVEIAKLLRYFLKQRFPDGLREVVFQNDCVFAVPTFPAIVTDETPCLHAVYSLPR